MRARTTARSADTAARLGAGVCGRRYAEDLFDRDDPHGRPLVFRLHFAVRLSPAADDPGASRAPGHRAQADRVRCRSQASRPARACRDSGQARVHLSLCAMVCRARGRAVALPARASVQFARRAAALHRRRQRLDGNDGDLRSPVARWTQRRRRRRARRGGARARRARCGRRARRRCGEIAVAREHRRRDRCRGVRRADAADRRHAVLGQRRDADDRGLAGRTGALHARRVREDRAVARRAARTQSSGRITPRQSARRGVRVWPHAPDSRWRTKRRGRAARHGSRCGVRGSHPADQGAHSASGSP